MAELSKKTAKELYKIEVLVLVRSIETKIKAEIIRSQLNNENPFFVRLKIYKLIDKELERLPKEFALTEEFRDSYRYWTTTLLFEYSKQVEKFTGEINAFLTKLQVLSDESMKHLSPQKKLEAKEAIDIAMQCNISDFKQTYNIKRAGSGIKADRANFERATKMVLDKDFTEVPIYDVATDKIYHGRSLQAKCERFLRAEYRANDLKELRANGINLVWCSVHGNCSDRCKPWQGKLYSLDGTTGVIDGIAYVPLETATEIYETTKSGKQWRNGLFGFNCRHYLEPYKKGSTIPKGYSDEVIKQQQKIDKKQRAYELAIAANKQKYHALRKCGIEELEKKAITYYHKATQLNKEYEAYSKKEGVAFYRERTRSYTEQTAKIQ